MKKTLCAVIFCFFATSFAQEGDYEYCIVWGVAGGAGDQFIQSLAGRVLEKKEIDTLDQVCSTLKQAAYRHGREFSQTGDTTNQAAYENWQIYQNFRDRVMDGLIETLGL